MIGISEGTQRDWKCDEGCQGQCLGDGRVSSGWMGGFRDKKKAEFKIVKLWSEEGWKEDQEEEGVWNKEDQGVFKDSSAEL